MKLVCPSCESGFLVDASAIGPTGRQVRCGRCGNSWLAMPVEVLPEEPPAPPETDAVNGEDRSAHAPDRFVEAAERSVDTVDPFSHAVDRPENEPPKLADIDEPRRRSRSGARAPARERGRHGSLAGWGLFAVVVVAFLAVVVFGRQQIVTWAPATGSLYALVGLGGEAPLPALPTVQLQLKDVTSNRHQANGTSELIIAGEIFNPTDVTQEVPPLVATLMDPTGIELKRWVFAAETDTLPPGGRISFQTTTDNPPGQGKLHLNFVPQHP